MIVGFFRDVSSFSVGSPGHETIKINPSISNPDSKRGLEVR